MRDLLVTIAGVVLVCLGLVFVYWPAAIVVAGVGLILFGLFGPTPGETHGSPPQG